MSDSVLHVGLVTLFPNMFSALEEGIVGQARKKGLVQLYFANPRDYATDTYRTVDDKSFGGGPGMVLKPEPVAQAIEALQKELGADTPVYYCAPTGRRLCHGEVKRLAKTPKMILLAGRYEGIDQRVIDTFVTDTWSIGDYVLSGGELAQMVMIDAVARLVPGVLGHAQSASEDSFANGGLDFPHYTRPQEWRGKKVPTVLTEGHAKEINDWREQQSKRLTGLLRPDLWLTDIS